MFRVFLLSAFLVLVMMFNIVPLRAELAFGGAWKNINLSKNEINIKDITSDKLPDLFSVFRGLSQFINETSLTIGYTLPAFGTVILETTDSRGFGSTNYYSSFNNDLKKLNSNINIRNKNFSSTIEHEATTSKINEDQLFYCNQRGLNQEEAVSLIVNGFCKEVLQQLPMEFAVEAQKLVSISLEGSVG